MRGTRPEGCKPPIPRGISGQDELDATSEVDVLSAGRWVEMGDEVVVYRCSADHWQGLAREAELCTRLRREGVPAPRCVGVDADALRVVFERVWGHSGMTLEQRVFGQDPTSVDRYDADCPITPFGHRLAQTLGRCLAMLHAVQADMDPIPRADWPAIVDRLHDVGDDRLLAEAARLRDWESTWPAPTTLVQADPHFGNLVVQDDGTLLALLDFGDAGLGHPGDDLKFLASNGPRFVTAALDAYRQAGGVPPRRLHDFHLRAAYAHLEHISPAHPRFAHTLRWIRAAIAAA